MAWTHIYDLTLKLATMFLVIGLLVSIPGFDNAHGIIVMALVLGSWYALYHVLGRTFSTMLYARFTLGMKLNYAQAKELNDAFTPAWPMQRQWLPMKDLRTMDPVMKYDTARQRLIAWKGERVVVKATQKQAFNERNLPNKIAFVALFVVMAYLFIASLAHLPPADRAIAYYCQVFDTNEYFPMIIWLLMFLPVVLAYALLSRIFNWPR